MNKKKTIMVLGLIIIPTVIGTGFVVLDNKFKSTINASSDESNIDIKIFVDDRGKCGALNENGDVIIEPIYDSLKDYSVYKGKTTTLLAEKDGQYGLIDENNKVISPFQNESPIVITDEYEFIDVNNGVKKINGEVIIPKDEYISTTYLGDGLFKVRNDEGKFGVVDVNNKIIVPLKYENIDNEINLLQRVTCRYLTLYDEEGVSISNLKGEIVIDKKFEVKDIPVFNDNVAYNDNDGLVILDSNGKVVARKKNLKVEKNAAYDENTFIVSDIKTGLFGIIDKNGKEIIKAKYDEIPVAMKKAIMVSKNNKYGVIDRDGNIIVPIEYEKITMDWYCNYILAEDTSKFNVFDLKGNTVKSGTTGKAKINNNVLIVSNGDKCSILDLNNNSKEIISFKSEKNLPSDNISEDTIFDYPFNKIIIVNEEDKNYYINTETGKLIKEGSSGREMTPYL